MEVIVLAGGFGTRLQQVVSEVPKSMAPVNGRPFLEYLLEYLVSQGVTRVVMATGYMHESISGHFGTRYKSLSIAYSVENEPLGTGGGIRLALWKVEGMRAIALNGDSLFRIPLQDLMEYHLKKKADATLALRKMEDTGRYGRVSVGGGGRITGFEEKKAEGGSGFINGGVYVIEKSFLLEPEYRGKFSIEKECFERTWSYAKIYGRGYNDYFLDIGVPDDYRKAQDDFAAFGY